MSSLLHRIKTWLGLGHSAAEEVSPEAKAVFASANEAALAGKSKRIDTGHVLLGLLRTTNILQRLDANPEKLTRDVMAMGHVDTSEENYPKKVLAESLMEARALGARAIDARLILVGLLRLERTKAHKVLTANGISLAQVRSMG